MSSANHNLREKLEAGIRQLGIEYTDAQIEQLMLFLALLTKWNKVYNLSAIKDPAQMVTLHLLDSLAVLPYLNGDSCIDVGTGAGLPGIPLAIMREDMQFTLLDSNSKKTRFIQQVCVELKINNIEPVQSRIEQFQPENKFDTVTARAFTAMDNLLRLTHPLLKGGGKLLAMKSKEDGFVEQSDFQFETKHILTIPGLDAERNVLVYTAQ